MTTSVLDDGFGEDLTCENFGQRGLRLRFGRGADFWTLAAGGTPSTWFPPGGLVKQRNHAEKRPTATNKHNDKAREHPNEKQK